MDEILIEEKKYVSSKRAAQMTGYAKDYVGQLCREGRVPARLVGRNWYVLESAIQDHRFGSTEQESEPNTTVKSSVFASAWESPRYEASSEDLLPSLSRSNSAEHAQDAPQHIQDSWKEWFDRFDTGKDVAEETVAESIVPIIPAISEESGPIEELEEPKKEPEIEEKEKDTGVHVPIRTYSAPRRSFYQPPPEELLPRTRNEESSNGLPTRKKEKKEAVRAIQVASISFAIIMVAIAIAGSGYMDEYIISSGRMGAIAGVAFYNR